MLLKFSKTFTMSGPLDSTNDADYGIVARVIAEMFRLSFKSNDTFSFRLSVLEIYNETLFDLLLNTGAMAGGGGDLPLTAFNSTIATEKEPKLTIIELDSGVVVPNLRIMPVTSPREAINFLLDAQANRAIAEHQLNARSSRSHVIYTFYVTRSSQNTHHTSAASTPTAFSSSTATANAVESDPIVHQSKIHLVDLAGSERVHKTGSKGHLLRFSCSLTRGKSSNIFLCGLLMAQGACRRKPTTLTAVCRTWSRWSLLSRSNTESTSRIASRNSRSCSKTVSVCNAKSFNVCFIVALYSYYTTVCAKSRII